MKKLFLTVILVLIALMFLLFAAYSEKVAVGFVYVLLAMLATFLLGFIHFGKTMSHE
jgi:hypothetical protein